MTGRRRLVFYTLAFVSLHALAAFITTLPGFPYGQVDGKSHLSIFYRYADRAVRGEVPYRDYVIEYPILAFPLFLIPRLLFSNFNAYRIAFGAQMLFFDAVIVAHVARVVAKSEGVGQVPVRLAWYTAFFIAMCPVVVGRYDLAPTALSFIAALWWNSGRNAGAGVVAGLGALMKIFPGVVAAPALVSELAEWRSSRLRGMVAFTATAGLFAGIWLAVGGKGVIDSFRYHSGRGLEIDSVYGGAIYLFGLLTGRKVGYVYDHFSFHVARDWGGWAVPWVPVVQSAALAAVMVRFYRSGRKDGLRYSGAAILAFIVTGKILSAQFLIWLFPFVTTQTGAGGRKARTLLLVCCICTTILYPIGLRGSVLETHPVGVLFLNYRNAMLLALFFLMLSERENGERAAAEGQGVGHVV